MTTTLTTNTQAVAPATGDGHQALWMLNTLLIEHATAQDTGGQYSVVEVWGTAAGDPPPHLHADTDEAFLVLEGTVDVTLDGITTSLSAGGFAFATRGVPHAYATTSEVSRMIVIASPAGSNEAFFRSVGTPADRLELPVPQAPDVGTVVRHAAANGTTILPPPGQ